MVCFSRNLHISLLLIFVAAARFSVWFCLVSFDSVSLFVLGIPSFAAKMFFPGLVKLFCLK